MYGMLPCEAYARGEEGVILIPFETLCTRRQRDRILYRRRRRRATQCDRDRARSPGAGKPQREAGAGQCATGRAQSSPAERHPPRPKERWGDDGSDATVAEHPTGGLCPQDGARPGASPRGARAGTVIRACESPDPPDASLLYHGSGGTARDPRRTFQFEHKEGSRPPARQWRRRCAPALPRDPGGICRTSEGVGATLTGS